jgi:hypothetical protein
MTTLKSLIIQIIVVVTAVIMILDFFFKDPIINNSALTLGTLIVPISSLAMGFGALALMRYYAHQIRNKKENWQYNGIGLISLVFILLVGFLEPDPQPFFSWISTNVFVVLNTAVFSIVSFYMASAAYRTMRIKTIEGTLLVVTAVLVMLGNAPIGGAIWSGIPNLTQWIMDVPSTAGMRGLNIVVALGTFILGLRLLLGRDKTVT